MPATVLSTKNTNSVNPLNNTYERGTIKKVLLLYEEIETERVKNGRWL